MPLYVAFLCGVSPMNLRMPDLKASLERQNFVNVRTVLSSGHVAFDCDEKACAAVKNLVESA